MARAEAKAPDGARSLMPLTPVAPMLPARINGWPKAGGKAPRRRLLRGHARRLPGLDAGRSTNRLALLKPKRPLLAFELAQLTLLGAIKSSALRAALQLLQPLRGGLLQLLPALEAAQFTLLDAAQPSALRARLQLLQPLRGEFRLLLALLQPS